MEKISPLMETPPKWHGVVAWLLACVMASSLIGVAALAITAISGSKLFSPGTDWSGYMAAWVMATITGMVLVAAPSFLLVWVIRTVKWRRGLVDTLAGFALGFAFPLITLLTPHPKPVQALQASFMFGMAGAITGFCYWAVARWLAGRWWVRQQQKELEVF